MPKLTIGGVATAGGVNVETIRYYQRRGLLEEPAKPVGGYRKYPTEIVKRIRFIKRAQALGFSLEDVAELLQLDDADACVKSCALSDRKLAVIDQKIAELTAMRRALAKLVAQCDKKSRRGACPIIEALQREPRARSSSHKSKPAARLTPRQTLMVEFDQSPFYTNKSRRHRGKAP